MSTNNKKFVEKCVYCHIYHKFSNSHRLFLNCSLGLERISRNIPENKKKPEDSSSQLAATPQDQGKRETAPRKKHFWSNWPVIGDAPKAIVAEQPETDPSKEKQQEHIEVKVDEDNKGKNSKYE